jgi:hypothetical protein
MSVYYPQAAMTLRILWEDFGEVQSSKLQQVYSLPIIARRVTVNINDYSQADTFDAEIDFKQFPFDPRAIRACGVTIHMENLKALVDDPTHERKIQAKAGSTTDEKKQGNVIFVGFADDDEIDFDDQKRTVRLQGRDYTALLIDRKYVKPGPLDVSKKLDVLISSLLKELKETEEIALDLRVKKELPVISKFATSLEDLAAIRNRKHDESYWDIIQDLVHRVGLIAYIELDKLVLTEPRALYDRAKGVHFVYGKNIKNLKFKRKLGRKKNFNVDVRCFNPENKDEPVITAKIPAQATKEWGDATGIPIGKDLVIPTINPDGSAGAGKPAPTVGFLIPNIHNKPKLIEIGQNIYEEMSRQQIEGSFETMDMESDSQAGTCFNLLGLRIGTPLKIQVDQGDLEGITRIVSANGGARKQKSIAATRDFLIRRCYDQSIAEALALTLNNPRFNSPFFTKGVQFTLDSESGFKIKVDFLNFIELPKKLGGTG